MQAIIDVIVEAIVEVVDVIIDVVAQATVEAVVEVSHLKFVGEQWKVVGGEQSDWVGEEKKPSLKISMT